MKKFVTLAAVLAAFSVFGQITPVNIGGSANDGTGDTLRGSMIKLNANDQYLDTNKVSFPQLILSNSVIASNINWSVATVSAKGIANGLSTIANDGAQYGPDTPGTTTSGLYEAYNGRSRGTEMGPTAVGIHLKLGSGYYYFTNALVFTNRYPFGLKITGNTLLDTKLVYAGPTNIVSTIVVSNAPSGASYGSMHVVFEDLGFSARTNSTNILVDIENASYISVNRCNFTSWEVMTNSSEGSSVSMDSNGLGLTIPGLVGLKVDTSGEHGCLVRDCFFAGLAVGYDARPDHAVIRDVRFAFISRNESGYVDNLWPTTSRYSLGADIILEPSLDAVVDYAHTYASKSGIVVLGTPTESYGTISIRNVTHESVQYGIGTGLDIAPHVEYGAMFGSVWQNGLPFVVKGPGCWVNQANYELTSIKHPAALQVISQQSDVGTFWSVSQGGQLPLKITVSPTLSGGITPSNQSTTVSVTNLTIEAVTNQITFGATNSIPGATNVPVRWISVQITGMTNAFRIPLYQ